MPYLDADQIYLEGSTPAQDIALAKIYTMIELIEGSVLTTLPPFPDPPVPPTPPPSPR